MREDRERQRDRARQREKERENYSHYKRLKEGSNEDTGYAGSIKSTVTAGSSRD